MQRRLFWEENGVRFVLQLLFAESEVHLFLLDALRRVDREGGIAAFVLAKADFPLGAPVLNTVRAGSILAAARSRDLSVPKAAVSSAKRLSLASGRPPGRES